MNRKTGEESALSRYVYAVKAEGSDGAEPSRVFDSGNDAVRYMRRRVEELKRSGPDVAEAPGGALP